MDVSTQFKKTLRTLRDSICDVQECIILSRFQVYLNRIHEVTLAMQRMWKRKGVYGLQNSGVHRIASLIGNEAVSNPLFT